MKKIYFVLAFLAAFSSTKGQVKDSKTLPVSTQLTLSKANVFNQSNEVLSVYFVINSAAQGTGTGFLLKSGHVVTNEHVVHNASPAQLLLIAPDGKQYNVNQISTDTVKDLAALKLVQKVSGGFEIEDDANISIGNQAYTWGFPLGYNGPNPLLSVGYIAGIRGHEPFKNKVVKHWVVNGAFNPGNSGGPLIMNGKIIGVVQSKSLPLTPYIVSALNALLSQQSGFMYPATDISGKQTQLSEGQIIGQILIYYQNLAQVMIGEAVTSSELKSFLIANKITGF